MAELKYNPVPHDHKAFLEKARARKGFDEAYKAIAPKYQAVDQSASAIGRELPVKLVRQKAT